MEAKFLKLNDSSRASALPLVVFDLDDTLADSRHRAHILQQEFPTESAKWDAFFDECHKDEPVFEILAIYNSLAASGHYRVEIWTGRGEAVRAKTEKWLSLFLFGGHDFEVVPYEAIPYEVIPQSYKPVLRMRAVGDFRVDTEVKGDFLKEAGQNPYMAFDDRDVMVKWWRDQGVTCLQVKESDF